MLTVEEYCSIRIAHRDGMSIRQIARRFNHSRRKVRQVLAESEPRPYTLREPVHVALLKPRWPPLHPLSRKAMPLHRDSSCVSQHRAASPGAVALLRPSPSICRRTAVSRIYNKLSGTCKCAGRLLLMILVWVPALKQNICTRGTACW